LELNLLLIFVKLFIMFKMKYLIISLLTFYSINVYGQLGVLIGGVSKVVDRSIKSINKNKFEKLHQLKIDSFIDNKLTSSYLYSNFGEPDIDKTIQYNNEVYRIMYYERYKSFDKIPQCGINFCRFNYYFLEKDTVRFIGRSIDVLLPKEFFIESDQEKKEIIRNNKKLKLERKVKYDYKDCKYEIKFNDEIVESNQNIVLNSKISLKNIGKTRCEEWVRAVFKYEKFENNEKVQKTDFSRFILKDIDPEITINITPTIYTSRFYEFLRFEKW